MGIYCDVPTVYVFSRGESQKVTAYNDPLKRTYFFQSLPTLLVDIRN